MGSNEQKLPYTAIVTVIAVIAIVVLTLTGSGKLSGANVANVYREQVETLQPSCLDNDPGNEYDVKGTVHMGTYKNYDYCRGDKLIQAYCSSSNQVDWLEYDCPNGCLNGFCL
ncbi:MAG TPA: hypothetical protein VJH68_04135 [Candidatus Nanoarchaeia archaeon]|nr:hypothetical protein [Candidatus Nanoarchaeia archaeon]